MKSNITLKFIPISLLVFLWILPSPTFGQTQKIKVVKDNAKIHLYPDPTSDVIGSVSAGQEFEAETKVGDWFKIQFYSQVGILIPGYIHEADVSSDKEEPQGTEPFKRMNIRLGVSASITGKMYEYEHSFPYREETFTTSAGSEPGGMADLNGGVGVFITRNLEISTGFSTIFSNGAGGVLSIDVPSPFKYNDNESDEAETEAAWRGASFSLGFNFYPVTKGKIRPYVGGELTFITGKLTIVDGFYYNETTYTDNTHSISISEIEYSDKKVSKVGVSALAGLNYDVLRALNIFLEGKFTFAQDEIEDPLYKEQMIEVNLSCIRIAGGIKFFF